MGSPIRCEVPIALIKLTGRNPAARTQPENLKILKESIKDHGVLVDLLITNDYCLVDGHRRLAAAIDLGFKTVPVAIVPDDLFVELNVTTRPMSGREWLQRYLQGGDVPPGPLKRILGLERLGGRPLLEQLERQGMGPSVMDIVSWVARYIGADRTDLPSYRKVIHWLVDGRRIFQARSVIGTRIPPAMVAEAIDRDMDVQPVMEEYAARGGAAAGLVPRPRAKPVITRLRAT